MKKELEELTDEIRKLRREVRELREAGQWLPSIRYVPQPVYVPWYPAPYQPYIPWWQGQTISVTPCTAGSYTITNNTGDYTPTTTLSLPSTAQISLT